MSPWCSSKQLGYVLRHRISFACLFDTEQGICFDALHNQSLTRLVTLALGIIVGIAVSDTARLHLVWEDFGDKVERVPVTIKDDLNATDALSSLSGDATVAYEKAKTTKRDEDTAEKSRKQSTAAWIAAQRQPSTSRATSRLASPTTNYRGSKLPSLSGLETRSQTSVPSVRAIKDAEYLASLTPLPPDSISESIDIGIHPPSDISRVSSPTIKEAPVLPLQSDIPAAEPSRPRTPKATVETVSSSEPTDRQPTPSLSQRSTNRFPVPTAMEMQSSVRVEEREPSVRAPSEHRHSPSPRRSASRMSAQPPPEIVEDDSPITHSYPTPSFAYHFPNVEAPSRSARSVASTRMTSRPAADLANAFMAGMRQASGSVYSKHSASRADANVDTTMAHEDAPLPIPQHGKSPRSERVPLDSPQSKREIIINYGSGSTQIYIPPPPSSGMKVRAVPNPVHSEGLQLHTHVEPSVSGRRSPVSPQPIIEEMSTVSKSAHSPSRHSRSRSVASNLDLETVPPDYDDDNAGTEKRSRPTSGEQSSEPQRPGRFNLREAWRDPPSSPSLCYSGHFIRNEDAIFDPSMNTLEADLMDRNLRPRSRSTRRMSESSNSRRPLLQSRSRSVASARTPKLDHAEVESTSKNGYLKSPAVVEIDRPSEEWFPNGEKQKSNYNPSIHSYRDPHEDLASSVMEHPHHRTSTLLSSSTIAESVLTRGPSANLIVEAQDTRECARDLERQAKELKQQAREAQKQNQPRLVFTLSHEMQTMSSKAQKLHKKADKLFYAGVSTHCIVICAF